MTKKSKETLEKIASSASTPEEGMNAKDDQSQFGVSTTQSPSQEETPQENVQSQDNQEMARDQKAVEDTGTSATQQQTLEPQVVEKIPIKVYGKEGEVIRYSDGKVVLVQDGQPKREFANIQEALQKALASEETFQKASLLKKETEEKEKALEGKRQQLAELLLQAVDKINVGGEEAIEMAKSLGIKIPRAVEEAFLEGDDEAKESIYRDILQTIKAQKDDVEKELNEIKAKLYQDRLLEVVSKEPIQKINSIIPQKQLGTLMVNGILHAVAVQAMQNGLNLTPDQTIEIANKIVEDVEYTIREYSKTIMHESVDEQSARQVISNIFDKYPAIREEIVSKLKEEIGQKIEAGKNSGVPTPQTTVDTGNTQRTEENVGISHIMNVFKKITGG